MTNSYSARWFDLFHAGIPESRTIQETEFLCTCAPLPSFRKVLDVCCGMGRHAQALGDRGYAVTGVERDTRALAKARERSGAAIYIQADLRDYQPEAGASDLAIVMSQSFGHFDSATNHDLLNRLTSALRTGGRLILDLWHAEFFAKHEGEREFQLPGGTVRELKRVENGRLFVHLDYPDGAEENFEWQLFTTAEMNSLAALAGLNLIHACTDFDLAVDPSPAKPRIQFVLERGSA